MNKNVFYTLQKGLYNNHNLKNESFWLCSVYLSKATLYNVIVVKNEVQGI